MSLQSVTTKKDLASKQWTLVVCSFTGQKIQIFVSWLVKDLRNVLDGNRMLRLIAILIAREIFKACL